MWRRLLLLALLPVLLWGLGHAAVVLARLSDSGSVPANTFTSDTLDPPTIVTAVNGAIVTIDWTATTDTYATGYRVLRATVSGGSYSQIAQLVGRTTTNYADSPTVGPTYYYVVRSYFQNWESVNSNESSAQTTGDTGFHNCSANAAVTSGSGDNNGYETNPANACANGGGFAVDASSGTGSGTGCTATGKDRHVFHNYGFAVPSSGVINGVEVRLDSWADSTANSSHMCVELSWDGGTSWTAPYTGANIATTETSISFGSVSDTWGRVWSGSDFTDANFRVRVTDIATSTARIFNLDWVGVKVNYADATNSGYKDCGANAPVTTGSGDNNGYETNGAGACSDGGTYASDANSGTGTSAACNNANKDRHIFFNYGLSVPAGATIYGIDIRTDAWIDTATNNPHLCVDLSWDGGVSWTAAQTGASLTTTEATYYLGASTDTWGRTWSASDLSDGNFRVRITDVAGSTARTFNLDWVTARVTYGPPNTGYLACSANAPVTSSSGDNDGFETNSAGACAQGGTSAVDANSGTGTGTSCAGTDKDRHLFYNYGVSIPSGSAFAGIEVRLDASADSASNGPAMCVQLSWDGGVNWTAAQSSSTLTTSLATYTLGSSTDNWGRAWSSNDLADANFRVRVTDVASSTARTFNLDWVTVRATYSTP